MTERTILIVGASGVVGNAACDYFARQPDWKVITLSRRAPQLPLGGAAQHLAVDLRNPKSCETALAGLNRVTHIVYAALFEKPGLVKGWREHDQMQINLSMLRNVLLPLTQSGSQLEHVSLLQGTKAYGVHLHPIAVPARESQPRDAHENFYWLQEDFLRELAQRKEFDFTIFRPQLVFGDALGVAMNLIPIIGVYAALCAASGAPFGYPGGPSNVLEATDARLLARALAWAATTPSARNQTFNITNGDVFVWRNVWPVLADALGVRVGPDQALSLAKFLPEQTAAWDAIVKAHSLAAPPLLQLLGESHHYADFCFGLHARETPAPVIVSTIKLRQAGFADCIDTEQMFRDWFAVLRQRRVLPAP